MATKRSASGSGTNMANGAIYSLQYDLVGTSSRFALIATQPFLIVRPQDSIRQGPCRACVAWLKANTDKASQGIPASARPTRGRHLPADAIGARWPLVPYRSAGLSMQDLIRPQYRCHARHSGVSMRRCASGNIKAMR